MRALCTRVNEPCAFVFVGWRLLEKVHQIKALLADSARSIIVVTWLYDNRKQFLTNTESPR